MKTIIIIITSVLVLSCTQPTPQNKANSNKESHLVKAQIDSSELKVKPVIKYNIQKDSLVIEGRKYYVIQQDPRSEGIINLTIINDLRDTIYIHKNYGSNGFDIVDFDNNGILDIRLYQMSNVGGVSELIMFDTKNQKFKTVENFDNFPSPSKIEKSKYWYSYHRSGCADSNWGSELFCIENFKAIEVGDLQGIGCEGEEENGIFAYKVDGNNKTRIFSELREPGYYADKIEFIANYWTNNYNKFE